MFRNWGKPAEIKKLDKILERVKKLKLIRSRHIKEEKKLTEEINEMLERAEKYVKS